MLTIDITTSKKDYKHFLYISVSEVLSTNDWDHATPDKNKVTYKDATGDIGPNPESLLGADSLANVQNPVYIDNGPPPYTEYARMARYIVHYSGSIQRFNIKYSIPYLASQLSSEWTISS